MVQHFRTSKRTSVLGRAKVTWAPAQRFRSRQIRAFDPSFGARFASLSPITAGFPLPAAITGTAQGQGQGLIGWGVEAEGELLRLGHD